MLDKIQDDFEDSRRAFEGFAVVLAFGGAIAVITLAWFLA